MNSFVYLSSDTPLFNNKTNRFSIELFVFTNHFNVENQIGFSYSKHFSEAKYQVASVNQCLPEEHAILLNSDNKKALNELFNYLIQHF